MKFFGLLAPCIVAALSLPFATTSAVIAQRQKAVESWVGSITPAVQACLDSQPCTRSAYIWDQCTTCILGHENPFNIFYCLCGGEEVKPAGNPVNFRSEWFGQTGQALPYQCAQCLASAVPAATDVAFDVGNMIGTYCYNPVRGPTPVNFVTLRQVEGFAENSTYTNKLPVTVLNFTVATKTPWTIPDNFDGLWASVQPWPKD